MFFFFCFLNFFYENYFVFFLQKLEIILKNEIFFTRNTFYQIKIYFRKITFHFFLEKLLFSYKN